VDSRLRGNDSMQVDSQDREVKSGKKKKLIQFLSLREAGGDEAISCRLLFCLYFQSLIEIA
jgi:hypothetical protein